MVRKGARIALGIAAGVLVLLAAALLLLVLLIDDADIARYAEQRVQQATGRAFTIGDLAIDWGWRTQLRATGVRLANAEWVDGRPMLQLERARASVDLPSLLTGDLHLHKVRLEGGTLRLRRNEQGRANWRFPEGPEAPKRAELPIIEGARIEDFTLDYRGPNLGRTVYLNRAGLSTDEGRTELQVQGRWEGLPLQAELTGGAIEALRDPGRRFPLQGEVIINETRLAVDGALTGSGAARTFQMQVQLQGPDLGRLFPIAGIPAPPTAPYRLNAAVERDGAKLALTDLNLTIGESDLQGRLAIDFAAQPLRLVGRLSGEHLDPKDVGVFLVEPDGEETQLLPRARILERPLHAMSMDVEVQLGSVETPIAPLRNLDAEVELSDGRLVIQPMNLRVADGRIAGRLRIDAVAIPGLGVDLTLRSIQMGRLLPEIEPLDATRITVGGNMQLTGRGQTVAQAIGNADGRIELLATGGRIDALLVEAAGLDVAEALLLLAEDGEGTPIRCAVATFNVRNGIARADTVVVDTRDSVLVIDGLINLRSETLNLEVVARAKDPSLLALSEPVKVQGPFLSPQFSIVGSPIEEIIGAAALAALFSPAAALLPFLELGEAESRNCRQLYEKVGE